MALGNWPVIYRFIPHDSKQLVGLRASFQQAGMKVVPDADSCSGGSHSVSPFRWMRHLREGCAKIRRREARCLKMFPLCRGAVNRNEYETRIAGAGFYRLS